MKRLFTLSCSMALASFLLIGCQPTASKNAKSPAQAQSGENAHDHGHEHAEPETLQEGLMQLSEAYAVIKTAFESNKPDDAHDPLHNVAHLLEGMKGLVEKSDLDADTKTKVSAGVETLFDSFGKIDGFFHGGPKVDFAELDKLIAPAMETLKGSIK